MLINYFLQGIFQDHMLELKNVPDSAKEARLKTSRGGKKKTELEEESQVTVPLEIVTVPEEQIPALVDPPMLYEEVSTTMVTTSAPESLMASWVRIAANAKKFKAVPNTAPSETYGKSKVGISHSHQRFLDLAHAVS